MTMSSFVNGPESKCVLILERSLLDMADTPGLCQGVFHCFVMQVCSISLFPAHCGVLLPYQPWRCLLSVICFHIFNSETTSRWRSIFCHKIA